MGIFLAEIEGFEYYIFLYLYSKTQLTVSVLCHLEVHPDRFTLPGYCIYRVILFNSKVIRLMQI